MKFLNIVIYSTDNDNYTKMYDILTEYYKLYDNVKTIFIINADNKILGDDEFKLENNILYIKGEESLVPGILIKTLKAFKYFLNEVDDYDYIIRTNISTIVNFDNLEIELKMNPIKDIGGGLLHNLQWLGGGITDSKYYGTLFYSGTSMIFKSYIIKKIVEDENLIIKDIVDDVSLGIYFKNIYKKQSYHNIDKSKFLITPMFMNNIDHFKTYVLSNINKIIFYRNRIYHDRSIDILQMSIIKNILLKIKL